MKNCLLLSILVLLAFSELKAQPVYSGDILSQYTYNPSAGAAQSRNKNNFRGTATDTFNVLHYIVNLNVTNLSGKIISGNCQVQFKSQLNGINQVKLDLMKLDVDSVTQNNKIVTFSYDSMTLAINLTALLNQGDSAAVTVYYHGHPQVDDGSPSFGGFYFSGNYAYNIGMSINEIPHNFGKVWHPCFDDFVHRGTYEYHIVTDTNMTAFCNGYSTGSVNNGNGTITWNWKIDQTIPTYLAGIAIAPYTSINTTFNGINGPVPVVLAAVPADTANLRTAFVHLSNAFSIYEQHYGPYRWNKVGYSMVPFTPGALEHSANIAYPASVLGAGTFYENLMAHELSHHWFGNVVTPLSAENVWLKEGWAVFSEKLFYEGVYGYANYMASVKQNHEQALHYAQVFDEGYWPNYPMPEQHTFGQTTYAKGPDMVYNLRTYMGDTLLFSCVRNLMVDSAFKSLDCNAFRDYLSNCSGVDLTNFFNDWIYSPGYAHFSIDTFEAQLQPDSTYNVTVRIRQRLNHATHFFNQVPMEITFMDANRNSVTQTLYISGACSIYNTNIPFNPVFSCLNLADKISESITEDYQTIGSKGTYNFPNYAKVTLTVDSIGDSAFIRIEHNFLAPDPFKTPRPNLHLSEERYWKVDGIFPKGFDASAIFGYNGTAPMPPAFNNCYLDSKLITASEDSMVLMYRPSAIADWKVDTSAVRNILGNATDKIGQFTVSHLKKGEYAFAIYQYNKVDSAIAFLNDTCTVATAIQKVPLPIESVTVYPNPASGNFNIQGTLNNNSQLEIFNLNGQRIFQRSLPKGSLNLNINSSKWSGNLFLIRIYDSYGNEILRKEMITN